MKEGDHLIRPRLSKSLFQCRYQQINFFCLKYSRGARCSEERPQEADFLATGYGREEDGKLIRAKPDGVAMTRVFSNIRALGGFQAHDRGGSFMHGPSSRHGGRASTNEDPQQKHDMPGNLLLPLRRAGRWIERDDSCHPLPLIRGNEGQALLPF